MFYNNSNKYMSNIKRIYFDHSATTPMDKKVVKAMMSYFSDQFGNASSLHSFGQEALRAIDTARGQVAKFLNCSPDEIVFTSGATEADNLAIRGFVESLERRELKIFILSLQRLSMTLCLSHVVISRKKELM